MVAIVDTHGKNVGGVHGRQQTADTGCLLRLFEIPEQITGNDSGFARPSRIKAPQTDFPTLGHKTHNFHHSLRIGIWGCL